MVIWSKQNIWIRLHALRKTTKITELKTEIFLGWIYVTLNQNPESLSENLKSLQTMVTI